MNFLQDVDFQKTMNLCFFLLALPYLWVFLALVYEVFKKIKQTRNATLFSPED